MNKRQIGSGDLHVFDMALGSWLTYGVGIEADQGRRCLDTALDEGINFIDTANVNGNGTAEASSVKILRNRRLAGLAQMVEQRFYKPQIADSITATGTTLWQSRSARRGVDPPAVGLAGTRSPLAVLLMCVN